MPEASKADFLNITFEYSYELFLKFRFDNIVFNTDCLKDNLGKSRRVDFIKDGNDGFLIDRDFTHKPLLEYVWAGFPLFIISLIISPSFLLLYSLDDNIDPKISVIVNGNQ